MENNVCSEFVIYGLYYVEVSSLMVNKRVRNAVLGCSLKNDRMISVYFQGKPFNIIVIQVYTPTSNSEEAEDERFCEDLQDLLELTPPKDVLFIIGDWNAKVGSQETPGVTGKFGLGMQNEGGQRLIEFCQENNSQSSPKLMSIELVMPSNHLILCRPLLRLPSLFPSIRVFSNESGLCIRWPKDRSFSFNISPFNEYSGLISFTMDWLDLLVIQRTLKSLLQHHTSKASTLWHLAIFIVQFSLPYMTTRKSIALTRWTFVGKVMPLLFNMLSRLVIAFLPRSKRLLISRMHSPSSVILEPPKIKSATVSIVSPSIYH